MCYYHLLFAVWRIVATAAAALSVCVIAVVDAVAAAAAAVFCCYYYYDCCCLLLSLSFSRSRLTLGSCERATLFLMFSLSFLQFQNSLGLHRRVSFVVIVVVVLDIFSGSMRALTVWLSMFCFGLACASLSLYVCELVYVCVLCLS